MILEEGDEGYVAPTEDELAATQREADEAIQGKVDEGVKAAGEKAAEERAANVPEKYELGMAEDSLVDPSIVERIATSAKERGLTNEEAQSEAKLAEDTVKAFKDSGEKGIEVANEGWLEELKADKEFGGDNYTKTVELSARVVEKFGGKELTEALTKANFVNFPPLVRAFAKIGNGMADDVSINPKAGSTDSGKGSMESRLYSKVDTD